MNGRPVDVQNRDRLFPQEKRARQGEPKGKAPHLLVWSLSFCFPYEVRVNDSVFLAIVRLLTGEDAAAASGRSRRRMSWKKHRAMRSEQRTARQCF